jgi:hypothetical protein
MAAFDKTYGAGLRHAWVRTANGDVYDIDAVVTLEGDPEQEETEVKGDDTVKAIFASSRKETLSITANGLSMDTIQAITGNSISSSATGAEIAVGTVSEMSAPFVEIGGMTNGKTADGTAVVIEKVFHKVQLTKVKQNMANESEFSVEMEGTAVQTALDITGAALANSRTGTIRVYQGQAS